MDEIDSQQPDKVILLGDLLYHGPRNNVPEDYAPKDVIAMLSSIKDSVIAVRGNCEAEVDQMVLEFPCMSDYAVVLDTCGASCGNGAHGVRELFCTHGHKFGPGNIPNIPDGSALVYGHTHVKVDGPNEDHPGIWMFNPGSVGIPKDSTHSCGIYRDGVFEHIVLE